MSPRDFAPAAAAQRPTPVPPPAGAVPNQPVAITRCEPASIYVADFDRAAIERILNRHFDGFTILPARGCWHKLCENSVVIQIASATEPQLRKAAEELRSAGIRIGGRTAMAAQMSYRCRFR